MQNPIYCIETGKKFGRQISLINMRRVVYIIKDQKKKKTIKRHHNQIRKTYSEEMNNQKEKLMKIIYDLFEVLVPLVATE